LQLLYEALFSPEVYPVIMMLIMLLGAADGVINMPAEKRLTMLVQSGQLLSEQLGGIACESAQFYVFQNQVTVFVGLAVVYDFWHSNRP
jgi:hypothetical protein